MLGAINLLQLITVISPAAAGRHLGVSDKLNETSLAETFSQEITETHNDRNAIMLLTVIPREARHFVVRVTLRHALETRHNSDRMLSLCIMAPSGVHPQESITRYYSIY